MRLPLWTFVVTLCTAGLLLATSSRQPMGWDEGDTIFRAEAIVHAWQESGAPGHATFWEWAKDANSWPFTTAREGHPSLAAIVIALGSQLAPSWFDPLTQFRFGPMLLFAVATGAMFYRLVREYRLLVVGFMAVGVLVEMSRMFAHAHLATLDAPLTACWLLAWAAFAPACRDKRFIPLFGLALGMTLSAKFTGWLAPLPLLAWSVLYRDRGGIIALAAGVPLAVAVFVALNPPLWSAPVEGLREFFALNLDRSAQGKLNISTQFFGRMYNLDYPLPWYNTLAWTAITITPMALLTGCMGIWASVKRWRVDRAAILLVLNWATLIIVRALPWSPPHDAERLILPSFAFFAALCGVGIGRGLYRESLLSDEKIIAQGWAKVLMTIVLVAGGFDAFTYFPHGLSYYNRLTGGISGATSLGMEPTYYWDSLDDAALAWLREHTADNEKVAFAPAPPRNLALLKRWGKLDHLPSDPGTFRWYVLQRRPSAMTSADHWLVEHATPAYENKLSGVPLLQIYSYADYERSKAATKGAVNTDTDY